MPEPNDLIEVFRKHEGGVGSFLSEEQKQEIREGRPNHAENKSPYDGEKLMQGVDSFFQNHPLDWLEKH